MELTSKVALIFAATGDVASEVARVMASNGAEVFLSARNLQAVTNLADEIKSKGGKAHAAKVDAMNESEITSYIKSVFDKTGKIDIEFNGIGITPQEGHYGTPFVNMPEEKFLLPLQVHVGSQFLTAKAIAPYMIQAKSGVILTLSASIGKEGRPFMSGVSAACAAIEGMTRVMASELGIYNVRVICLRGGAMFETKTIKATIKANAKTAGVSEEIFGSFIKEAALLKRAPSVSEVASVASFLVSDKASAMTGQSINVSAGLVLH